MSLFSIRHDQTMMILVAPYQITCKHVIFITRYCFCSLFKPTLILAEWLSCRTLSDVINVQ